MKPLVVGVLLVVCLVILGLVIDATTALPWYYKLVIAAPFLVLVLIFYSVTRRRSR